MTASIVKEVENISLSLPHFLRIHAGIRLSKRFRGMLSCDTQGRLQLWVTAEPT